MKQKYFFINLKKYRYYIIVIFVFALISLIIIPSTKPTFADSSQECINNIAINFDTNPKSGLATDTYKISGSVTVNNLYVGNGYAQSCFYTGTGNNIKPILVNTIYVTVYDKNTGNKLMSDIAIPLGRANSDQVPDNQTYTLPNNTFIPSSSWSNGNIPNNIAVAALTKVTDGNGNWSNMAESTPIPITFSAPATGTGGGNLALGKPCDATVTDQCGAHLSCDPNQNPSQCVVSLTQGATCNSGNNLCDAESGLSCVNGTCQTGTTPATGAGIQTTQPSQPSTGMAANSSATLYNPISGASDLTDLLIKIMQGFLGIIGAWAVAFIVIGAFKMIGAQGNEEGLTSAKKTITWAVIGLVVAILAFAIIAIVQNLIGVNIQPVNSTSTTTTGNPPSNTTGNPPNNTTGNPPN